MHAEFDAGPAAAAKLAHLGLLTRLREARRRP